MRGITPRREQGMADPVLAEMVHATGATESRHFAAVKPTIQAYRASWVKLAPYRNGPVNTQRVTVNDPAATTAQIKAKAAELGANLVGVCRLRPHMIDLGSEVPHEFVIACCVAEDYEKVLEGPGCGGRGSHADPCEVQAIPIFLSGWFRRSRRPRQLDQRKVRRELSPGLCDHGLASCGR